MNDILLIGNNVEFSGKHKGVFERSFFLKRKTLVKLLTYWASGSIEIDQDADKDFSLSTYLDNFLKEFKMDQSKKKFLPVLQGVKLSKTQNPTMAEDRERMKVVPYASAVCSIKYAMMCT